MKRRSDNGQSFEPAQKMRWSLTKQAFDTLLRALDPHPERAGEVYLQIRRNLVRFFEGRGCPLAEDHADEVINRVARKLEAGAEIRDFNSYVYGVARMLMLEILKEREKEQRAINELPALQLVRPDVDEIEEKERRLACLARCLEKLPIESRELIVQYYQGDGRAKIENRQRLAEQLNVPLQALRSRAVRLREKLESCLISCQKRGRRVAT